MTDRYHNRQSNLIDPAKLDFPILVAGIGTIGSWTTLALDKIGCSNLHVVDPDTVEIPNVGCQAYTEKDVSFAKVNALATKITAYDLLRQDCKVEDIDISQFPLIINAVDSMVTRKYIFENLLAGQTLIDGRMAGNAIEIYTAIGNNPESMKAYEASLFESSKARPIPCGMKAVAYNGFVCAGLIADLVAKFANGEKLPAEILVDLKNFTLFTG